MRSPVPSDTLRSYQDLANRYREGVDYAVGVRRVEASSVVIMAPHGGKIEGRTSDIARLIAGEEHSLYLFEGLRETGDNFDRLHLGSRWFDEPRGLELASLCEIALTVHGYTGCGADVLLGGLHDGLKHRIALALAAAGVSVEIDGHRFPGVDPHNICNRCRSGQGVQLELSETFRKSRVWGALVQAVRMSLAGPAT